MRKKFTMSQDQLDKLLDACKPTRCMMIGGVEPRSPQENANAAWKALGEELGFEYMTVQPDGSDKKCFTAEEKFAVYVD